MSSNYNGRLRPAEILVKGYEYFVIRERETWKDLLRGEKIPGFLR
jgi:diaminopimelate decarboxylase